MDIHITFKFDRGGKIMECNLRKPETFNMSEEGLPPYWVAKLDGVVGEGSTRNEAIIAACLNGY